MLSATSLPTTDARLDAAPGIQCLVDALQLRVSEELSPMRAIAGIIHNCPAMVPQQVDDLLPQGRPLVSFAHAVRWSSDNGVLIRRAVDTSSWPDRRGGDRRNRLWSS